MSNEPSNDDFLDQLYAETKHEQPPLELDAKIQAQALEHLNAKNRSSFFQWQRVLSLAAVMVLSVYLFFDVNDARKHETSNVLMDDYNTFAPSKKAAPAQESAGALLEQEQVDTSAMMIQQSADEPAVLQKPSKELLETTPIITDEEFGRSAQTSSAEQLKARQPAGLEGDIAASESRQSKSKSKTLTMSPSQSLSEALSDDELSAQSMLADIERHLARGETALAREVYQALIQRFPDYDVPESVVERLNRH